MENKTKEPSEREEDDGEEEEEKQGTSLTSTGKRREREREKKKTTSSINSSPLSIAFKPYSNLVFLVPFSLYLVSFSLFSM